MKLTNITVKALENHHGSNSYFYGYLFIDGIKDLLVMPCQYGYGEQYLEVAKETMISAGLIPKDYMSPLWVFCKENDIKLNYHKKPITLKEYREQDKVFKALALEHARGIDGINLERAKDTE